MGMDELEEHRRCVHALLSELGTDDIHGLELVRLLATVANQCEVAAAEALRTEDLSVPRFALLMRLLGEEVYGGRPAGISPTDLSRFQQVSKNSISSLLRGLEEHGFIERTLDPDDRRAFRIRVSAAGKALISTLAPQHLAHMNDLMDGLDAAERGELARLLGKLHRSLLRRGVSPQPVAAPEGQASASEFLLDSSRAAR